MKIDHMPHRENAWAHSARQGLRRAGEALVQSVKDLFTDNVPEWSAAVAYYAILSAFPLLIAAVSISAYFVDPASTTDKIIHVLKTFVPQEEGRVREIIQGAISGRGTASFISTAIFLWSGSRVFGVLVKALNIVFDVDHGYNWWKSRLIELGLLLSIGMLFSLAMASGMLVDFLWHFIRVLPAERDLAIGVLQWILPFLLLCVSYFLLYRLVPGAKPDWRSATAGAGTAALLFAAARPLFSFYLKRLAHYNLIYGSLAIGVGLLVWAWLVSLITLIGGELVSHLQMMVFEGQSAGEVGARHQERSPNRRRIPGKQPEQWKDTKETQENKFQ